MILLSNNAPEDLLYACLFSCFIKLKFQEVYLILKKSHLVYLKVREFVKGYNVLQEMGFTSKNVAEVLAMYDNDTDKALAHLLNN